MTNDFEEHNENIGHTGDEANYKADDVNGIEYSVGDLELGDLFSKQECDKGEYQEDRDKSVIKEVIKDKDTGVANSNNLYLF